VIRVDFSGLTAKLLTPVFSVGFDGLTTTNVLLSLQISHPRFGTTFPLLYLDQENGLRFSILIQPITVEAVLAISGRSWRSLNSGQANRPWHG